MTDNHGVQGIDFLVVTVNPVPPHVDAGFDVDLAAGETVFFSGSYEMSGSVSPADIQWDFNYDGETFNPDPLATGSLDPTHRFTPPGTYTVALRVTDSTNVSRIDTIQVTVVNARPVVSVNPELTITQGQSAAFSATVSSADPVTIEWDFDYARHETFIPDPSANGLLTPSHQYLAAGTHLAAVRVTNTVGGARSVRFVRVTVENVSPGAAVTHSGPVAEGSPVTLTVSNISEINPAAIISFEADWTGDREFETIPAARRTVDPVTGAVRFNHTFDDSGTYTVTIRVLDGEEGYSDFVQTVTVTNVASTVVISPHATVAGVPTIGPNVPIRLFATDPSHADQVVGFTYFLSVNGGAFVESTTGDFLLPSYVPGSYTLSGNARDKDGDSGPITETPVTVSAASMILQNNGNGSVRLTWAGAGGPVTLGPNQSYNFGGIVSGLAVTLLTSQAYYELVTNGSIDQIDFEPGVVAVSLDVDTGGHIFMPPIVGDGHVGVVYLPGGNATVGSSRLSIDARGDLEGIVGPAGSGKLWAEAVDLSFNDLNGSITGLDFIRQIDARWLGGGADDWVWANHGIFDLDVYGIRATLTSDRQRNTFNPLETGSSIFIGHGGASGSLDLGHVEYFGTQGAVDRVRVKLLDEEIIMEVGSSINQLQVDATVGATGIRGDYGKVNLLALGERASENPPALDYFPLAQMLVVNASPQEEFWNTIGGGKPQGWHTHHVYPDNPVLAARLQQERGVNIQDKVHLRGVPASVHDEITALQNRWRAEEMRKLGLNPNNAQDVNKFYKKVDLKKLDELNEVIEKKCRDFWVSAGAKKRDVDKIIQKLGSRAALTGLRTRFLNGRLELKLGKGAAILSLLSLFESVTFAETIANEPPEAKAARERFITRYAELVEHAAGGGALTQSQMLHLANDFNDWMKAVKTPEGTREQIYRVMFKKIHEEFPTP